MKLGTLFIPKSNEDYSILVELLNKGRHAEAWIGIIRKKWIWNKSKITMIENLWSTNTNWLAKSFRRKCMLTKKENNNQLSWITDDCLAQKSFVCEFG